MTFRLKAGALEKSRRRPISKEAAKSVLIRILSFNQNNRRFFQIPDSSLRVLNFLAQLKMLPPRKRALSSFDGVPKLRSDT